MKLSDFSGFHPVLFDYGARALYPDHRGIFFEAFREDGIPSPAREFRWVQDNVSMSHSGVLRGIHFQSGQAKLLRVLSGRIFDVVVDIRQPSPTYGKWVCMDLDPTQTLFIPDGFAHGFCNAEPQEAWVSYKVSEFYRPELEGGIFWADPFLSIPWPVRDPILSERDSKLSGFSGLARTSLMTSVVP